MRNEHYILRAKLMGVNKYLLNVNDCLNHIIDYTIRDLSIDEIKQIETDCDALFRTLVMTQINIARCSNDKLTDDQKDNIRLQQNVDALSQIKDKLEEEVKQFKLAAVAPESTETVDASATS